MQWKQAKAQWMFVMVLVLSGCATQDRAASLLTGTDPNGGRVKVYLYKSVPASEEPICLVNAPKAEAEMKVLAKPPRAARERVLYLRSESRQNCAGRVLQTIAYWQTREQVPELCLYRDTGIGEFQSAPEGPIMGVWDFCATLSLAE